MKNFRTYEMALNFYREAKDLPLTGAMKDQFERALLSIPLNLAEGSAKPTSRDRTRIYSIALGSLREVQALLTLVEQQPLIVKADRLGASLYHLIKNPGGT